MHDAIVLANLLYALPSSTSADIVKIFEEYKKERHPIAMESYNDAHLASKMDGRGFFGALVVSIATSVPKWLWIRVVCALPPLSHSRYEWIEYKLFSDV